MTATTAQCVCCGKPVPGTEYACSVCALRLAESLREAAGHAEDAEAVLARQTRYGAGSRGGSGEGITPDLRTSARYGAVVVAIGGWASLVIEESGRRPRWHPYLGPLCPPTRPGDERDGYRCDHDSCAASRRRGAPNTLVVDAAWLAQRRQVDFLRKHPAAKEAFDELHDACYQLARLVDRPADKDLVGMCDCGKVLYAGKGVGVVTCPVTTCKLPWDVGRSREILRKNLGDKLVAASEAARLIAYLDGDRTQDAIRKLIAGRVKAGRLVPHGEVDGEPTYRFGEVVLLLADIPRRRREPIGDAA